MHEEIKNKIKEFEADYKKFMGIDYFPEYSIVLYTIDFSEESSKGYACPAKANYKFEDKKHVLSVCENLPLSKYNIFHEFTHILDTEMYSIDKKTYSLMLGYTEYHASQVELMCLLGADTIKSNVRKHINDKISLFWGESTIGDYVLSRHNLAVDIMTQASFPDSVETVTTAIRIIYNYLGLRSICKMFIDGYDEKVDNSVILQYISSYTWTTINAQMQGWLDIRQIHDTFSAFYNALFPIFQKYNLN